MSLQLRYEALVSDMVLLLQEAIIRFITAKPTDIDKFKHYFNRCYEKMTSLEQQFHQFKMKVTSQLSKLRELCVNKAEEKTSIKISEIQSSKPKKNDNNNPHRYEFQNRTTQRSQQLMTIQEVSQNKPKKKRVETAGSQRKRYTAMSMYGRPATEKNNAPQDRKIHEARTIGYESQAQNRLQFVKTNIQQVQNKQKQSQQAKKQQLFFSPSQVESKRKSFYDDLQKSKEYQHFVFNDIRVQSILKKRTRSQQKWNKISRLL